MHWHWSAWIQPVLYSPSPDTLHQFSVFCSRRDSSTWFHVFRVYTAGRWHLRRSRLEWRAHHNTWAFPDWRRPIHPSIECHVLCIHTDIWVISCRKAFIPGEIKKKSIATERKYRTAIGWEKKNKSGEVWLLCKLWDQLSFSLLFPRRYVTDCWTPTLV